MRRKLYSLREKETTNNVYSYFKANSPLENKKSLIRKTAKATKSSFISVRRISEEKAPKSFFRKKSKQKGHLDDFDLGAVKRAIY